MILEVLKYPDPFLRTKAEPVTAVDSGIKTLIEEMVETMYLKRGIGLAAVQVGVAKRVIVLDVPEEEDEQREKGKNLITLVNPEVIESEGSTRSDEGCLSVPGVTAEVERAASVRVKGLDRDGEAVDIRAEGLFAIALQHEIDHLEGILFIDKLSWLKRDFIKRRLKKAAASEMEDVSRVF